MKKLFSSVFFCSLFFFAFFRTACGQIPATINSAGTWSASAGSGSVTFAAGQCYTVTVEAWGGGGGGGGASGDGASGGGSGGGFAQGAVTISGGSICYYSVGAGGTAGTTAGTNGGPGGPTWFNGTPGTNNNTTGSFINGGGGAGGNGATTNAGAAAQTTVGAGTFGTSGITDTASHSGGTGGGGFVSGSGDGGGGGGGGGAGTGGNGGNGATTIVGGTGAFGCPNGGGGGGGGGGGATGPGANGNPGNNNGGGGTGGAANGGGTGGTADNTAAGLGGNGTAGGPGNPLGGGGGAGNGCCGCSGGAGGDGAAGSGSIGGGGGGGTGDGGGGNGGNGGAHGGGGAGADGSSTASGGMGGSGYLSITVAIVPPPTATAGPAQAAICQGGTTTIMNGSVSAGATALWTGGAGTWTNPTDPVNATYTAGATETGTITLTLTATSACGTGTATETLTINPSPAAPTVTSPVMYCQNAASSALTATGAGSLLWYTVANGGTGSGTAPSPLTTNAGQTTYYVSQTENGCESARDSIVVIVNALPAASAGNTGPFCSNGTISLSATGGNSYSWSGPNGYTGTGAAPAPFSAATYGAGTYTVTVTGANTCTATASTMVALNTPPTAVFTTNSPICISQTLNVTYTGTGNGGATYAWTFNGGNPSTSNAQSPPGVSYSAPGTDSVSLTVSENGCSSDTTIAVTITALPTSTFNGPAMVCAGQPATFTYTGNASASASFSWGFAGGTPLTGNTIGPYQVTWTTAGPTGVGLWVIENGCSSDTTFAGVTVNATPVSNAGPDISFCSGASDSIGSLPVNGNTYAWTPATGLSSSSVADPTINLTNTTSSGVVTNYTVTTTTTASGCSSTDTVAVTVNPAVVLGIPVVQNDSCYGQSNGCITATVTAGTTPYDYQWSTGAVSQSAQLCSLPAGSYAFTVTDGDGCSDSLRNITVSQPDSLTITTTVNPVSCPGQADGTIQAALTGGTQPYTYSWSNNTGNINPDINLAVGNYSVTVNDAHSCTISATATITVLPALGLTDVVQNVLCLPLTDGVISVSVASNFPPITYAWSNGATDSTVTGLAAGIYSVTVSDAHHCTADTTLTVGIASSYSITALPHDTTINLGGQVPITVNTGGVGGGVATVSWEPPYGLSCVNCATPVASPAQSVRYTVTITSDSGCTAVDTVYVEVIPVHEIYVPNVFAPNGNGANSTFQVFGNKEAWEYFDIGIFDRWGEKVFESHDMDFNWDGTYKGKPAAQGAYVYEIHVVYADGYTGKVFTGSITLLR